jgi:glycosyltransferase involved in cell wall biosynthesis
MSGCNLHNAEVIFSSSPNISPMVSVVVPTFNRPDMLSRALKSILGQAYKSFEIIVVNDAGEDVEDLIAPLNKKNNITYIRHRKNSCHSAARNTAIKHLRGKYIAYLDDDDIFYPNHLQTLVDFLESSDCQAAYTDAYRVLQEERNGVYIEHARELKHSHDFDYDRILVSNLLPILCMMHEKCCLDEVGLFDESFRTHEDWDMWVRLSRRYKIHHIQNVTAEFFYRADGNSMSSRNRSDFLHSTKAIYEKYKIYADEEVLDKQGQTIKRTTRKNEAMYLAEAYMANGNIAAQSNRHEKAYEYFMQAVDIYKGEQLKEELAAVYISAGNVLLELGDSGPALDYFQKSLALVETGRAYFKLGLASYRRKDYSMAKRYFENTLELTPDHNAAKNYLRDIESLLAMQNR